MHPILASRRWLLAYLLAWIPVLTLLVYVACASGGISWRDAAAVLAPACLVYAFACLSPWYICRVRPLHLSGVSYLLSTWGAAALAVSLLLLGSARLAAYLFERAAPQPAPLFGMGVLLYLLSAGLHYAALAAETSRAAERRAAEARTLAREAELQALRAQIDPHFLFNSLHSIAALATVDGARAREMCVRLAGFLRGSLALAGRESIPLREELALARGYLEVEQVRFGPRLRVGRGNRAGLRRLRGSRPAAAAAGRERRQARHRRLGGRRRHTARRAPLRRIRLHRRGERLRPRNARAAQDGNGPGPRSPPVAGALR